MEKGSQTDFERIAESLKVMESVIKEGGDRREADEMFHKSLFQGVHNAVLESFNEIIEGFFARLRTELFATIAEDVQWLEEHRAIYEALLRKDVKTAQTLMRNHLERYTSSYGVIPKT